MTLKNSSKKPKLLLVGFGDIAKRLTKEVSQEYEITGLRRSSDSYAGVTVKQADCRDESAMIAITQENFDVIVITMTPSEMSDEGYEQAYVKSAQVLVNALDINKVNPSLIVFVSSSSVYGQHENEWVDESSETLPNTYSGKRLLEAEKIINESAYFSTSVRFSGIYGLGRERLIEQVRAGNGAKKEPALYSNRIHSDDCAGVLAHILRRRQKALGVDDLYLATDCQPSPLYDVKYWLAEQLGFDERHLQPKELGRTLRNSKRCRNQRLLDSGYQFLYPTFKEGYKMVLDNLK